MARLPALVYRLVYNGDVTAGQLAVFQGASEAPISESYGSSPAVAGRKNSQLAPARRVAMKMGRLGETYRCVGVSAFAKHHQLRRDLLIIIALSRSGLTSPDADTPIRRPADTLPLPAAHFDRNKIPRISGTGH